MRGIKYEPAMYLYALNSVVALVVSFGLPLTTTQTAAIATIATGLLAAASAFLTRPIEVSAISGAVATALTATAAFGLHLSGNQIGSLVTVLSLVLALILRQNLTPAATVKKAAAQAAHPAA